MHIREKMIPFSTLSKSQNKHQGVDIMSTKRHGVAGMAVMGELV